MTMEIVGDLGDLYGPDGFDAEPVDDFQSSDPIPPGWYYAEVESMERKVTKDETGVYLNCKYRILGHVETREHADRRVFGNINLKNKNPKAEDYGTRELAALCRAVKVLKPRDTSELLNKPFVLKVKIKPAKDGYEAANATADYKPIGFTPGKTEGLKAPQQPLTPPQTPQDKATPPWMKKGDRLPF